MEVSIECNTGLPLNETVMLEPNGLYTQVDDLITVEFIVQEFDPGQLRCEISENTPAGYFPVYKASIGNPPDFNSDDGQAQEVDSDDSSCFFEHVESGLFSCEIFNHARAISLDIEKEWVDENPLYELPTQVEIELSCDDSPPCD